MHRTLAWVLTNTQIVLGTVSLCSDLAGPGLYLGICIFSMISREISMDFTWAKDLDIGFQGNM